MSPFVMTIGDLAETRLTKALTALIDHDIFIPTEGEKIKAAIFDSKADQLDVFFMEVCEKEKSSDIFLDFIKAILVMFHGNAAVERSFSFNEEFLVENLQEPSLTAQRSVHDYIINTPGGIKKIIISQPMITAFRNSSSKREDTLAKKKIEQDAETIKRKQALAEMKDIKLKKQKALDAAKMAACEAAELKTQLQKLEKSLKKT